MATVSTGEATMSKAVLMLKTAIKQDEAGNATGADNWLAKAADMETRAYDAGQRHKDGPLIAD